MINLKKIFIALICIFLLFHAVSASQLISIPWWLLKEINKEDWQEFYNQSFDYFYNGEYDEAIQCLEKARELNPDNLAIYWRLTYVFGFEAEYGKNSEKDIKELEKMFNQAFSKGMALCNPNSINPEILFYMGGLYGNRVLLKQALGQKKSALEDIGESRKYLREIKKEIKETQDFYDEARGYLGIFNYWPIVMSTIQKIVFGGTGYKWNLKQGLQQIKDSINYGKYGDDIELIYRGILQGMINKGKFEDRIPEAIELTEDLLKKYPRNSLLKENLKILKGFIKKRK